MARANAAYYAQRDPFADFTTAPEISQAFGEILGAWCAVLWAAIGAPDPVRLVELGPGRGTLMADARRAIRASAPGLAAAGVHLVETSARLRAIQAARVPEATHHGSLDDVPPGPMLLLANEFFDVLPIRQYVRRGAGWVERWVADGTFVERPGEPGPAMDGAEGAIVEIGAAAQALAGAIGARVAAQGGAALVLDYGPAASAPGDSLQAIRDRRAADPLADPGSADLTAHVDFAALGAAARAAGAAVFGPVPQGLFLARLGLFQRTARLAETQTPERAAAMLAGARRLAEPDAMGRLFKTLAICHPAMPAPPGFEPA